MKTIVLTVSALVFLLSCITAQAVTTQAKIDQITIELDQRTSFMTKEEIVRMLGMPDKTQVFVGVYYFIYETGEKENYLFTIDEHNKHIYLNKIDPNDPKIVKLFNLKVNVLGIPLDEEGRPIVEPKKEESQKTKKTVKEKTANRKLAEKYYDKAMSGFGWPPYTINDKLNFYSKAIEVDPTFADAYNGRAYIYKQLGNYEQAIRDFEKSIELEPPIDPTAYHIIAWLLATCEDPKYRDGKKAVQYAEKAVLFGAKARFLGDSSRALFFNTLAAAYAESGDFDKAEETEKKAYKMEDKEKDKFKELIEAYKNKKTYVQWEAEKNKNQQQN